MIQTLYETCYLTALDVYFARTIARIARETRPLVLLGAAAASRFSREGHVCLDLSRIAGKPMVSADGDRIGNLSWPGKEIWIKTLRQSRLTSDGSRPAPLVLDSAGRLYLMRYWMYQQRLVRHIQARAAAEPPVIDESLLQEGLGRLFPSADGANAPDWQRIAAAVAVRNRFALISGGPGTGKTTTVAKILILLLEQALSKGHPAPQILLTAPTGKAAARLSESILNLKNRLENLSTRLPDIWQFLPQQGMTIHRALGMRLNSPGRFEHGPDNPLAADILILDEASMVSLALMTHLLEGLPASARLILLGDKDQLVSVEAGAILGDICNGCPPPEQEPDGGRGVSRCICYLKHNFRSQPDIDDLARLICKGAADQVLKGLSEGRWPAVEYVPFREDELPRADRIVETLAAESFSAYLRPGINPSERLRRFGAFRILCAHQQGMMGVERLNRLIEMALKRRGRLFPEEEGYAGRPVMITRNDYPLQLFNGDIGLFLREGPGRIRAFFQDSAQNLRSLAPARLPSHVTVFAMTIHKSQGSEFDHVCIALPPKRSPVITRELIYTAVTRARNRITLLAPPQVLQAAIERPVDRASGLSELLRSDQRAAVR